MKIKNTLVVTLYDFSRLIDFSTFQFKRKQFVRDLNPQRCYYPTGRQKLLFDVIKTWTDIEEGITNPHQWPFRIEEKEEGQPQIAGFSHEATVPLNIPYEAGYQQQLLALTKNKPYRYTGIIALCEFIQRHINLEEIKLIYDARIDKDTPIIKVLAGAPLYLKKSSESTEPIKLKKIEVIGENDAPSEVYIDNTKQKDLFSGECAYVTSRADGFIQLLPNRMEQSQLLLTLCNLPGEYTSNLLVEDTESGKTTVYQGVTSFTLGKKGFAYIEHGKLKSRWYDRDTYYLLQPFDVPVSVASNEDDHIFVLLEDGTIKSTAGE